MQPVHALRRDPAGPEEPDAGCPVLCRDGSLQEQVHDRVLPRLPVLSRWYRCRSLPRHGNAAGGGPSSRRSLPAGGARSVGGRGFLDSRASMVSISACRTTMTLSRRRCSMLTGSMTTPPPVLITAPLFGSPAITFRSSSRNRSSPSSWKMVRDGPAGLLLDQGVRVKEGEAGALCNDLPDLGLSRYPGNRRIRSVFIPVLLPVSASPRTPGTTCSHTLHP